MSYRRACFVNNKYIIATCVQFVWYTEDTCDHHRFLLGAIGRTITVLVPIRQIRVIKQFENILEHYKWYLILIGHQQVFDNNIYAAIAIALPYIFLDELIELRNFYC